jgi:hypothetical protein
MEVMTERNEFVLTYGLYFGGFADVTAIVHAWSLEEITGLGLGRSLL